MRIEKDTIAAGIVCARPAKMDIWRNGMRASCVRRHYRYRRTSVAALMCT